MKPVISYNNGFEFEIFSKYRRMLIWQRGEIRKVKRAFNKRLRKFLKLQVEDDN